MICRVLKRDMEFAMMDELVEKCRERGIMEIDGYYYPTAKNGMVRDFYAIQGFEKTSENEGGDTVWKLDLTKERPDRNHVINIERN